MQGWSFASDIPLGQDTPSWMIIRNIKTEVVYSALVYRRLERPDVRESMKIYDVDARYTLDLVGTLALRMLNQASTKRNFSMGIVMVICHLRSQIL